MYARFRASKVANLVQDVVSLHWCAGCDTSRIAPCTQRRAKTAAELSNRGPILELTHDDGDETVVESEMVVGTTEAMRLLHVLSG